MKAVCLKIFRLIAVKYDRPVEVSQVRKSLEGVFGEAPIIKTIGSNNQLNITTSYKIKETGNNVDSAVAGQLRAGLKP